MMDETESQEIVVDFGKICRLCLTGDGVLISLFSTDSVSENGNKSITDKIMDLMSIMVIKNDGFPSWICHNCLSQVDKCYEFFDQCRTNQAALNESYIAALTEAGINVVSMKVKYEDEEPLKPKSQEKLISVYNNWEIKMPKKEAEESSKEGLTVQFQCIECSQEFTNANDFSVHKLTVHNEELTQKSIKDNQEPDSTCLYDCDLCGAKFHNKNAITTHIRFKHLKFDGDHQRVDLEKVMLCKYCGLSFSRKNVSRHLELIHRMTKQNDGESDQREVGSFDCKICYRPFLRQSSLRSHIEKVHGDNLEVMAEVENCEIVWKCNECDSIFLEELNLMHHYGSKHSKYPLEVDALRGLKSSNLICACGVISSNSFDASLHSIFHHSEMEAKTELECPGCEKMFPGGEALKIHLISHHWFFSISYDNECVFCDESFDSNDSLRVHLNQSHRINFENELPEEIKSAKGKKDEREELLSGEEEAWKKKSDAGQPPRSIFVCETCGEFHRSEKDLRNHVRDCCPSHGCKICGKTYKTNNHLKRHVAEFHNTLSPIKCPLCPKIFPRKMNLHHHYKRRHLKQTKKFVCSYCGQSLKGIVALRSHEDRLHRNVRSYKCSQCPEAFTTRGILRKHAQRHLSDRPMLHCQFCEKKFSTISGIERHIKTHEGVKEFQCETPLCGKSFYTKSELKRHVKFHTRDFKHVCPVCGHKFMSPGELKKHSTKHTGERPFKCHLCSCAYARRDDKVKHLKRVHNLKVKRVYGKSLIRSTDQEDHLVDTIVIDEETRPEDGQVAH